MDFGGTAQIGWIVLVVLVLAAILYFKRPKDTPPS